MKFESEEEKKIMTDLCDIAQQVWDRGSYSPGEWPQLEEALKFISPIVYPDFNINEFLGLE